MLATLHLFRAFLTRDLANRYRSSALGWAWYILNPLFLLSVFTLVFSTIFGMRWGGGESGKLLFALNVFAGLLVNSFFAESWQRAAQSVLGQPALVKKVSFPLYLLPMVVSFSALAHCVLGLAVLLAIVPFVMDVPVVQLLYAALALPPMLLLSIGVGWLLAGLTVYLRDLAQVLALALTAMMFLAPVFYPMSQVPEHLQVWLLLNPITVPAESLRVAFLGGTAFPVEWLLGYWAGALLLFGIGALVFRFLARGFADVL